MNEVKRWHPGPMSVCDPETKQAIVGADLRVVTAADHDAAIATLTANVAELEASLTKTQQDRHDARARVVELEAERQWRSMDSAPKDGTTILVALWSNQPEIGHTYAVVQWEEYAVELWGNGWRDMGDMGWGGMTEVEPDAWMPLPRPPHADRAKP